MHRTAVGWTLGILLLVGSAGAHELQISSNPVVVASVQLNPGPDDTSSGAILAAVGPLQGGVMDNFTFGRAGIFNAAGATGLTLLVTDLYAAGESFSANPFTAAASVGTGLETSAPNAGEWVIDVVPGPGDQIGDRVRIDISVDLAGNVAALGDNLEGRAAWLVRTDHGVVAEGMAESLNAGTVPFAVADCLSFTVRIGEQFTLETRLATEATGDSNGASQGGDASATFQTGTISLRSTKQFTPTRVIEPIGQTRSVGSSAFAYDPNDGVSDSDLFEALDFAPFSSNASSYAQLGEALSTAGASQTSNIRVYEINASGSSFATAEAFGFGDYYAEGYASSVFEVQFILHTAVAFEFSASLAAYDFGGTSVSLIRDDDPNAVLSWDAFGPSQEVHTTVDGTLPPGTFTLRADAGSGADGNSFQPGYAFSEYAIKLGVGARFCNDCAADLDGDGQVALSDLATLLANFGTPGAAPEQGDIDGDGDVDVSDLAALLAAFGTNCT